MIILEGPDGAGKTSLLDNLLERFPDIEQHERASTSKGGPVDNIFDWGEADILTWQLQPLSIYDRHPMVSEPIYGGIIRGGYDPRFDSQRGLALMNGILNAGLMVMCLPPLEEVMANVARSGDDQMNGVADRIVDIYEAYKVAVHASRGRQNVFWYDYTRPNDLEQLVQVVKAHQIQFNRNRGIYA